MKGKDVKCPACMAPPKDIDPELDFEDFRETMGLVLAVQATCENGHLFMFDLVRPERGPLEISRAAIV